ncbi:hypothetical protein PCA31118_02229 [Pandoraea captiosa]|uniref:DUF2917 domain-containing protein n=1 Tax=Pandoraea captiosa TaxID=2508302 RepID=A0A5E5A2V0_9BURK|nr:hypothetical protein [Pandoraea captiosa]VVE66470.1 hypothetical protein PCA31118_02229 [Pandoraea captiosa]
MAKPLAPVFPTQSTDLTLMRGQSFHGYVSRGTVLHVGTGRAVLTPASHWLSESIWRTTVPLTAGQVHVVQTSGWMTLTSETGARIVWRDNSGTPSVPVRSPVQASAHSLVGFVRPLLTLRRRFGL